MTWGFRLVTARTPDEHELSVLQHVLEDHLAEFNANPDAATRLIDSTTTRLQPDHLERDKSHDAELAAWTMIANLLLNLDETVTKG